MAFTNTQLAALEKLQEAADQLETARKTHHNATVAYQQALTHAKRHCPNIVMKDLSFKTVNEDPDG